MANPVDLTYIFNSMTELSRETLVKRVLTLATLRGYKPVSSLRIGLIKETKRPRVKKGRFNYCVTGEFIYNGRKRYAKKYSDLGGDRHEHKRS